MSDNVSGFLKKLGKINDDKLEVYVPSRKEKIETTPLTLKQQKDLISSALDGMKGALNFNRTLNNIIFKNTGDNDLKIYDKFPLVISLRKHSLGSKYKQNDVVFDLDVILKKIKTTPFKIKDSTIVELKTLQVELKVPTLAEENSILAKGEQDIVIKEESTKEGVGMLYMLEIIKYIDKLIIEEEEVEFSKIKINDRIKLIEQLPLSMYNDIADYIEKINKYLQDVLTVDETTLSIDARFFDTTDID